MKKYTDTFLSKIKRLSLIILCHSLWVIPTFIGLWYVKNHLSLWCDSYFGIPNLKKSCDLLARRVNQAGSPVLWNPATIGAYMKLSFLNFAAHAHLSSVQTLSGLLTQLGSFLITVSECLLAVYALIRVKRSYRIQTQTQSVANSVCSALMPEILALRQEVQSLRILLESRMTSAQK